MDPHRLAGKRPLDLCEICASAFRNTVIDLSAWYGQDYPLHATVDGFINAADQGCFICYNVLRTIGIPEQEIVRSIRDSIHQMKRVPRHSNFSPITCFFAYYIDQTKEPQTKDISRLWITVYIKSGFFNHYRWDYDPSDVPELQAQLHYMENFFSTFEWMEGFSFDVTMAQDLNSRSMKTIAPILSTVSTPTF